MVQDMFPGLDIYCSKQILHNLSCNRYTVDDLQHACRDLSDAWNTDPAQPPSMDLDDLDRDDLSGRVQLFPMLRLGVAEFTYWLYV